MVRVFKGVLGGLALAAGLGLSAAVAEAEKYKPRIECGDRVPQGKMLYNGKRQQERLGPVVDQFKFPSTGTHVDVYQRAALFKGSNCWVTFWSIDPDDDYDDNTRMTGRFIDPLVWREGQRDQFGGFVGYRSIQNIIVALDKATAQCVDETTKVLESFPPDFKSLPKDRQEALVAANRQSRECYNSGAKALDERGFIGMWYSSALTSSRNFAVLDGKLIVWTEYLGE